MDGWLSRFAGEGGPGGLPVNSTSQALEASRVVQSGAATLFGVSGFNAKVSAQFVLIFDGTAIPANGAIPVVVVTVPTVSNFSVDFGFWGRAFHAGIIICNSSTPSTLTIGSADCWFDAQYV